MLFNVESDSGDRIVGYFVPDGFSDSPKLRVASEGETLSTFVAQEDRPSLVVAGRHQSGRCGFHVDEAMVPGLSTLAEVEIRDDATELLVYRRATSAHVRRKVVRFETHLYPLWRIDERIRPSFAHFIRGAEFHGLETVTQHLMLTNAPSSYLSGRIGHRPFAFVFDGSFDLWAMVHEPFAELAERLLVLRKARAGGVDLLGPRDGPRFAGAADFAASLPAGDERILRRALRDIPPEVAVKLSNPLVRQLTGTTPDDMPSGAAVGAALDALSTFKAVGLRDDP
ncbi:MAG: hypothetical protein KGI57_08775, partial [Hyphomicrobiales bacterium]|nr:hypothetical protein [Hyphomicrobiales bacterium]